MASSEALCDMFQMLIDRIDALESQTDKRMQVIDQALQSLDTKLSLSLSDCTPKALTADSRRRMDDRVVTAMAMFSEGPYVDTYVSNRQIKLLNSNGFRVFKHQSELSHRIAWPGAPVERLIGFIEMRPHEE